MTDTSINPARTATGSAAHFMGMRLPVSLLFALREIRGGFKGFRIFMACLILGVATVSTVTSLISAIDDSFARQGKAILGGDLEVRLRRNTNPVELKEHLSQWGDVSSSARLRTMARTNNGNQLVELRAVDTLYPLYGTLETEPQLSTNALLAKQGAVWGVSIDPLLRERLNLKLGDIITFGSIQAEIRAVTLNEPDKANLGFQLGPSVLIDRAALEASGLVTTGSLVDYMYKLRLDAPVAEEVIQESLKEKWPEESWRIRDYNNSAAGLRRSVDQVGSIMLIVSLTALIVGGVGVGNAIKSYMSQKVKTIATFKILGATGPTIFKIYLWQVLIMGLIATLIGLLIGTITPFIVAQYLPASLPLEIDLSVSPAALLLAASYGIFIALGFTIWPLAKARDLPAIQIFRSIVTPLKGWPRKRYIGLIALIGLIVAALAVGLSENPAFSAIYLAGALAVLGLLRGIAALIELVARLLPRASNTQLRLAISNIHRPNSTTSAVVISLGLGLSLLVIITLIQQNFDLQLREDVPSEAPAFFMLDINRQDADAFRTAATSIEGVSDLVMVPSLRGTITALNGVPATEWTPKDESFGWILRGDRGLSFGNDPGENNTLVEGNWWPDDYSGPPEVSFGRAEAEGLGLKLGDMLTINVLGRSFEARISSLRDIEWGSLGFNFVVLFDPNTLAGAPYTYMATMRASGAAEKQAHSQLTDQFPTITAVRMKEALSQLVTLLEQISSAVKATALVVIIAGMFVLAGAIAAGFQQRVYDSVILKVIGARRSKLLAAYTLEFMLVGLIVAFVSLLVGVPVAYLVITGLLELTFRLPLEAVILVVIVGLGITLSFGLTASWRALSASANKVLRDA